MVEYRGKDRTVVRVLRDQVERFPDKPLLCTESRDYSRQQVDKLSNMIAHGMLGVGITGGEKVLLMLTNTELYIFSWLALAKLGAIEVPVHTAYKGHMLVHAVNESGARFIIIHAEFLPVLHAVREQLNDLRYILIVNGDDDVPVFTDPFQVKAFQDVIRNWTPFSA